eukprot:TRINITY_DN720_c0_g2_i1.p1 TRINITY_DN720_c0_g2~~TRINITY_DN720_c0_g2_i1.p1  ORF type:complete len:337 (-),score=63.98 TRINITY_DN720_c0_g2_i1:27-1037(-)
MTKLEDEMKMIGVEATGIICEDKFIYEISYEGKTVVGKFLEKRPYSLKEIKIMEVVRGIENMAQIVNWFELDEYYLVLMEKYPYDLYHYMTEHQNDSDYMDVVNKISTQLIKGLESLHDIGVFHADIKPANIFLDEDKNAYYADFGFSDKVDNKDTYLHERKAGTISFCPAELLISLPHNPFSADIFSLGMTIYCILTKGDIPFNGYDYDNTSNGYHYKLNLKLKLVNDDSIIGKMCQKFPENRPSASDICRSSNLLSPSLQNFLFTPMEDFSSSEEENIDNLMTVIITNTKTSSTDNIDSNDQYQPKNVKDVSKFNKFINNVKKFKTKVYKKFTF